MSTSGTENFTDIHCHLLPGIDDGPKNWRASLELARQAVDEGIGTLVATPHQLDRYLENTAPRIRTLAAEAQTRLDEAGIPLTVLPGADVRIHENLPELARDEEVLTLADRRLHLLLELPHEQALPLGNLIYRLQCEGISCILTHPERNQELSAQPNLLRPWVQQGCLVQITAGSITGHFGSQAQRTCRWLLDEGLVHVVASDAHDAQRRPFRMRAAHDHVCRWLGPGQARTLFVSNPRAIVRGKPVEVPLPISLPHRGFAGWWAKALRGWSMKGA